jgi:hypothetical protein
MVCKACIRGVTGRYDMLLGSECCISHRAGVAGTLEPTMSRLITHDIQPIYKRDLLPVLTDTGWALVDMSVVHTVATWYMHSATQTSSSKGTGEMDQICGLRPGGVSRLHTVVDRVVWKGGVNNTHHLEGTCGRGSLACCSTFLYFQGGGFTRIEHGISESGERIVYQQDLSVYGLGVAAMAGTAVLTL